MSILLYSSVLFMTVEYTVQCCSVLFSAVEYCLALFGGVEYCLVMPIYVLLNN